MSKNMNDIITCCDEVVSFSLDNSTSHTFFCMAFWSAKCGMLYYWHRQEATDCFVTTLPLDRADNGAFNFCISERCAIAKLLHLIGEHWVSMHHQLIRPKLVSAGHHAYIGILPCMMALHWLSCSQQAGVYLCVCISLFCKSGQQA